MMFANRIGSSTDYSICLPKALPPSSSRGGFRHAFKVSTLPNRPNPRVMFIRVGSIVHRKSYKRECQETFFSARLRRRMLSCIQPPTPSNTHALRLVVLDLAQQERGFGF